MMTVLTALIVEYWMTPGSSHSIMRRRVSFRSAWNSVIHALPSAVVGYIEIGPVFAVAWFVLHLLFDSKIGSVFIDAHPGWRVKQSVIDTVEWEEADARSLQFALAAASESNAWVVLHIIAFGIAYQIDRIDWIGLVNRFVL